MTIFKASRVALIGVFGVWLLQMIGCATPQEVAQDSLADLYKHNVAEDRADEEAFVKDIGFTSPEEVADAQLGSPLPLYTIPVVQLGEFRPGDDPEKLLTYTNRIIFPLIVNGQARSSLTVRDSSFFSLMKSRNWKGMRLKVKNLDWKGVHLTEIGFPRLMSKIEKLRPSSSSFLISVVPLRLFFLGDNKGERLVLTAIEENPYFELKAGDECDAVELLGRISPFAKRAYESARKIRQQSPEESHQENPPHKERAAYTR